MLKLLLIFLCQLTLALCVVCPSGGFGSCCNGRSWTHFSDYDANGNITALRVWFDEFVTGIQVRYGSEWSSPINGQESRARAEIVLDAEEYIMSVDLMAGELVDQITFNTNENTYGPYGGWGGTGGFAEEGSYLAYIAGREGGQVDQLNFYFEDC